MARPIAQSTMMTRNAAKIQAASSAIALLIPGPAAGARQDWSPAARSTAREYRTSRGLAITIRAIPVQISPSGATSATRTVTSPARPLVRSPRSLPLQLRGLALDVLDPAAHEEGLLRDVVVLALAQRLERGHRLGQRHEHARLAGELLGDEHRVRQEPLDPP